MIEVLGWSKIRCVAVLLLPIQDVVRSSRRATVPGTVHCLGSRRDSLQNRVGRTAFEKLTLARLFSFTHDHTHYEDGSTLCSALSKSAATRECTRAKRAL